LRRHQFSFGRIDGSTPMQQRQRLVDHYNRNRAQFILLMSTKACGLGLNLTSANVVVLWEPSWNVALDLQAMDRAHRIGQQRDCHIYRLISEGTVEEVTYRRQIYKQMLANIAEGKGVNQQSVFKHSELFGSHLLFSLILNQIPAIGKYSLCLSRFDPNNIVFNSRNDGTRRRRAWHHIPHCQVQQ
jgi:SNF2 family DNA or RNA helicase